MLWDSDNGSPSRKESDADTSPEADEDNTLTPLSLPLPSNTTTLSVLNRYALCYGMVSNLSCALMRAQSLRGIDVENLLFGQASDSLTDPQCQSKSTRLGKSPPKDFCRL